jgi:transposase InsO family protein
MPWRELSLMDQREAFVRSALEPGANISALCRRFGISRDVGHKWLRRYAAEGASGLADRSRRPRSSPKRTKEALEAEVLRIRVNSNDAWGGRKIAKVLKDKHGDILAASTVTEILRRHGQLERRAHEHPGRFQHFERTSANELWQMDFKGHFALAQGRCHPLTVLDDHSRYSVGLEACSNEQEWTTRTRLTRVFRRYGLPSAMLMDNGSPWGHSSQQAYTGFAIWLMRLDIRVLHGRACHPQTQGKDERFHRTLKAEVLYGHDYRDLADCQRAFDTWRQVYNQERPHQALGYLTPSKRYERSSREYVEKPSPIEYGLTDIVRKVSSTGYVSFQKRAVHIGAGFHGQPIALRQTDEDGVFTAHFCRQAIGKIDLRRGIPGSGSDHQQLASKDALEV